jgi:tripartite-type tricarboxylate transporter receptor subunit TctC
MAPMIKAGLVRALGTTGKTRSSTLPEVPTMAEAGVPGFNATLWVGFMAPAGTPQPIVDKLNQEITKILARPDIKEAWEKTGASPIVMTQAEFKAFMDDQVAKWANVIKANHIPAIN